MIHNLKTKPIAVLGHFYFVLLEEEDGNIYPHGIVVAPLCMTHEDARKRIDDAYRMAVETNPETWNWEQVLLRIEAYGFQFIECGYWVEHG